MKLNLNRILIITLLVLASVISIFPMANWYSAPENHDKIIASIDSNVSTVLRLTAASTAASAAISMIPDDTATPIADKLADFTEYFLLILCVLYTEKYLLTLIGALAFKLLIPAACVLAGVGLFWKPELLHRLGTKLLLFAIAASLAIPASIWASDKIYDTYQQSIDTAIVSTEKFTEQASQLSQANGDSGILAGILNKLSETVSSLTNKATAVVNNMLEMLAVMIVTSCVIPLLVVLFFVWLIKVLTGVQIPVVGTIYHREKNTAGAAE